MLRVIYDPNTNPVGPDGEIDKTVKRVIELYLDDKRVNEINVGSELAITRFRLAVARCEIESDDIEFWFKDEKIPHRPDGTLVKWPKGFCDVYMNYIKELTVTSTKRPPRW